MECTAYHVAGERWWPGQNLECWDALYSRGIVGDADWHWDDAPIGYDGGLISLHETLEDAQAFAAELGGTVLAIEIDDAMDVRRNDEGYLCVADGCIERTRIRIVE